MVRLSRAAAEHGLKIGDHEFHIVAAGADFEDFALVIHDMDHEAAIVAFAGKSGEGPALGHEGLPFN